MESVFVHNPTRPALNRESRWSRYSLPSSQACIMIAKRDDTDGVPLAKRRRLDAGARQLSPAAIVVVQPEIALEPVGTDDVVLAVREAEHDPARGILAA